MSAVDDCEDILVVESTRVPQERHDRLWVGGDLGKNAINEQGGQWSSAHVECCDLHSALHAITVQPKVFYRLTAITMDYLGFDLPPVTPHHPKRLDGIARLERREVGTAKRGSGRIGRRSLSHRKGQCRFGVGRRVVGRHEIAEIPDQDRRWGYRPESHHATDCKRHQGNDGSHRDPPRPAPCECLHNVDGGPLPRVRQAKRGHGKRGKRSGQNRAVHANVRQCHLRGLGPANSALGCMR